MPVLTPAERKALLYLACGSIRRALLASDAHAAPLIERIDLTPALEQARGAFVSLKEIGPRARLTLRGCIGNIEARDPLYRNVMEVAVKAATQDPRFAPLTVEQLTNLRVEVSALTPLASVPGPQDIVPGRDGVELSKGSHRAVFLPQVAAELGWSTEQLLGQLALKAGLPEEGWADAALRVFQAEVFAERMPAAIPPL